MFATDDSVWDAFLEAWPLERLRSMTLEEYTQAGSKDTFTYWMESRLDKYGSIWGGSAFKFAIYSRSDKAPRRGDTALAYTDDYAWYRRFGATPQVAFEAVRAEVAAVAEAARSGNLEDIDKSELGPVYRWKIAFHYQDRAHPRVTCVFVRKPLLAILGLPLDDVATPMYQLQQKAMAQRPAGESALAFGASVWQQWVTSHPLRVDLSDGAVKNGYVSFNLSQSPFPETAYGDASGKQPGELLRFHTDRGEVFETDVRATGTTGRLRHRFGSYFAEAGVVAGDVVEIAPDDDGGYRITHIPKHRMPATASVAASVVHAVHEPTAGYTMQPVNKILFGPPGTGKTFHTVDEALKILDPEFLVAHAGKRTELKARFDELADARRIRFVTFHQSFSYEDFVEGIRASTDDETDALRYDIQDGVFKEICDAARSRAVEESRETVDLAGRRIWKMSLGEAISEADVYDDCIANNYVLLGFGEDLDYAGVQSAKDIRQKLVEAGETVKPNDFRVTAIDRLVRGIQVGDLVVVSQGNLKLRAIGEVTGAYKHIDRDGVDNYSQSRPVRWLRRYEPAQPYTAVMKNKFSQMSIYELHPGSIDMEKLAALLAPQQTGKQTPDAYVLIIDEINRGNVSRIFGELITLIEPSKRVGAEDALTAVLPYSKEAFSVPQNVHLIGTMNTADRSLAGLDVALRRRFEFVEMLPEPELLDDLVVAEVNIGDLLRVMNERIEVLMGRDYMLGHAYFLDLRATPTIGSLAAVFRDRVLPLLQEYFYEDWQKIAWVLNDHRKKDPALKFVTQSNTDTAALFGGDVELPNNAQVWHVNADAFEKPEAYAGVIAVPKAAT